MPWPISRRCCWPGGRWRAHCARKSLWADPPFNGRPPATEEQIGDLVVWGTFGVILGGRLGWDLIYGVVLCSVSPDADFCRGLPYAFVTNPAEADRRLGRRHVVHGGLLGVVLAVWLFCRRHKLACLSVADLVCAFAPMGLFFGRLANFVNGELWGRVTNVPWAMIFPRGGPLPRHPSQLYEAALEGILLFIIVQVALRVFRAQNRPGLISGDLLSGLWHLPLHQRILPRTGRAFPGSRQHGHGAVDPDLAGRGDCCLPSPSSPGNDRARASASPR